ncbi:hypothetical protein BURMUCF1_A1278 [Burkholderia multivorans ATCC BAA-247]|nr:hypothetical protein BURMUCF1_A1278 [Burkholderia multivorans ATCC BAA-247]
MCDWEEYERTQYGYPSYLQQSFGYAAAVSFIQDSAAHITQICERRGIELSHGVERASGG